MLGGRGRDSWVLRGQGLVVQTPGSLPEKGLGIQTAGCPGWRGGGLRRWGPGEEGLGSWTPVGRGWGAKARTSLGRRLQGLPAHSGEGRPAGTGNPSTFAAVQPQAGARCWDGGAPRDPLSSAPAGLRVRVGVSLDRGVCTQHSPPSQPAGSVWGPGMEGQKGRCPGVAWNGG